MFMVAAHSFGGAGNRQTGRRPTHPEQRANSVPICSLSSDINATYPSSSLQPPGLIVRAHATAALARDRLKDAHAELDAAVLAAYGFNAKKDLLAQLLELNREVASRIEVGEKVVAPGIPPDYPHPKKLITDDCIQPRPLSLV
jgi:hypothetical protein